MERGAVVGRTAVVLGLMVLSVGTSGAWAGEMDANDKPSPTESPSPSEPPSPTVEPSPSPSESPSPSGTWTNSPAPLPDPTRPPGSSSDGTTTFGPGAIRSLTPDGPVERMGERKNISRDRQSGAPAAEGPSPSPAQVQTPFAPPTAAPTSIERASPQPPPGSTGAVWVLIGMVVIGLLVPIMVRVADGRGLQAIVPAGHGREALLTAGVVALIATVATALAHSIVIT